MITAAIILALLRALEVWLYNWAAVTRLEVARLAAIRAAQDKPQGGEGA
jgi:hypothetical protein